MSAAIPAPLQAHLDSGSTSLAMLWKLTRRDGQVFGFTDHDQPITFEGLTYATASAYETSAVRSTGDLAVDNLEAEGLIDADGFTAEDLEAGLWDGAQLELREVNWRDLGQGARLVRVGELGEVQRDGLRYRAELRGLSARLANNIGRALYPTCDAALGDARCGVDLAPLRVTTTIHTVLSAGAFTVNGLAQATGWFDFGEVEFLSGLNAGQRLEIKRHELGTPSQFELQLPTPRAMTAGDSIRLLAGCAKTKAACKDKFNNLLRFRGFSFVPNADQVLLVGGQ